MKTFIRILLSSHYWQNQFSIKKFSTSFFASVGVIAAGLEAGKKLITLFQSQSNWLEEWLSGHYYMALITIFTISLLIALATLKPTIRVSSRLRQRDLTIAIEVGDLFDTKDPLVVGTNCTFDTDVASGLISPRSVQGQFTKRYYSSVLHLDSEINLQLRDQQYDLIEPDQKKTGKRLSYPMGTVVKVEPQGRATYLLAMARINTHGVASSSLEDLQQSLASLWLFIGEKAGGLPKLRSPILGSGFAKIVLPRQEIIKKLIRSLVAAATEHKFCEQFTIVITVNDYLEHQIDLVELGDFLRFITSYTELREALDVGRGTGIGT